MTNTASVLQNLPYITHDKEVEKYLFKVLEVQEHLYGEGHPETLVSMNNLGVFLIYKEDNSGNRNWTEEAERYLRRALELQEGLLGEKHPDTLITKQNLGKLFKYLRNYVEAEHYTRKSLELQELLLGEEHPETLKSLGNLAAVLMSRAEDEWKDQSLQKKYYEEAVKISHRAMDGCSKLLGELHNDVFSASISLTEALVVLERYEEAEKYYMKQLDMYQKLKDLKGLDKNQYAAYGAAQYELAHLLVKTGSFEKAHEMAEASKENFLIGEPAAAETLAGNLLGKIHYAQADAFVGMERYEEAEEHYKKALEVRVKLRGKLMNDNYEDVVDTVLSLVYLLVNTERYEEALKYFKKALDICENSNGPEDSETLRNLLPLAGQLYDDTERYEEALKYFKKLLDICENSIGPEDSETLRNLQNFAVYLRNHEMYEEAEKYYALLLKRREHADGLIHPDTGSSWYSFAKFQNAKGDLAEAEKACRKAMDILTKLEELNNEDIGNTQLLLAEILANTDQEKEALKMAKAAKKSYKITEDEELVGKADELIKEIQSSVESKRT